MRQVIDSFAAWASHAANPEPASLRWPRQPVRQCVVTVATGYPAELLKPLVLSLREHSDAPLVIIASAGNDYEQAFAGQGVIVHEVRPDGQYRPYPALARLKYYLEVLAGMPADIAEVLLVDSRDIVFQADPFATGGLDLGELAFFAENDDPSGWSVTTTNGRWAWSMLPAQYRKCLKRKPVVNGGVIYGTPAALAGLCRAKLSVTVHTGEWTKHTTGLDNISTNVVAHACLVPGNRVIANHRHVANVYRTTPMQVADDGKIVSPGGEVCAIVHMYDRRDDLKRHIYGRYDVKLDGDLVIDANRALTRQRRFATLRHFAGLVKIAIFGR